MYGLFPFWDAPFGLLGMFVPGESPLDSGFYLELWTLDDDDDDI